LLNIYQIYGKSFKFNDDTGMYDAELYETLHTHFFSKIRKQSMYNFILLLTFIFE